MNISRTFSIITSITVVSVLILLTAQASSAAPKELVGFIDSIDYSNDLVFNTISGWAIDPRNRTAPIEIEVMIDRLETESFVPNIYRPDVATATGSNLYQGFHYPVPHELFDGERHELVFYSVNQNTGGKTQLNNSPFIIERNDPGVTGFLDDVNMANPDSPATFAYGWVFDNADDDRQVPVLLYENNFQGKYLGSGVANLERADVDEVFDTGMNHGFVIELDVSDYDFDQTIQIAAYAIDKTSGELKRLGTRPYQIQ